MSLIVDTHFPELIAVWEHQYKEALLLLKFSSGKIKSVLFIELHKMFERYQHHY